MFDVFKKRYIIDADIRTKTAIHIGANNMELKPRAVDNEFIKDINGYPFIPGSSLKGVMRSFFEKILKGNGYKVCTITNLCLSEISNNEARKKAMIKEFRRELSEVEFAEYVYVNICPVCAIFGGLNNGSKLMLRDARLKDPNLFNGFEIRNGVTIDRDTNTAVQGHLYEVEVVPADTLFSFRAVAENVTEKEWKYILLMLKSMEAGNIEIGGMLSRGLGSVTLENIKIEKIIGKDIFDAILKNKKVEVFLDDEMKLVGEINV